MKKIYNAITFFFKVGFLVILLLFGWVFVHAMNLVKGKKTNKDIGIGNSFGVNDAYADVPPPPGPGPGPGPSCPFVACFDGEGYKLENDILFGRPKSYWPAYETAKAMYEDGRISPDL